MAKQKVRATRHNGRKGENGVFKAGHNDRSFDVDAAEHIDPSRSFMNVYWDMYQGYNIAGADGVRPERRFSFEEIEKAFYSNQFGDSLDAQAERHIKSRHKDGIRTMDQIREDPKTCPEETVYQLGTKDGHEDPALFVQVVAELVEEFMKRFGSNVQVLDWALHMDEATPHIHERHGIYVIANHESTENDAYHWKRWRRKISNRSCT
ncbi:MAG: plasmid recombination protein [Roseburia faecis]|nr:plasmid recombination protein [Roseburia faecis]